MILTASLKITKIIRNFKDDSYEVLRDIPGSESEEPREQTQVCCKEA